MVIYPFFYTLLSETKSHIHNKRFLIENISEFSKGMLIGLSTGTRWYHEPVTCCRIKCTKVNVLRLSPMSIYWMNGYLLSDVALNKPALQSSLLVVEDLETEPKDEQGNPVVIPGVGPDLAVDGNMSSIPSMGSCAMTALEVDPWWRVDLQSEHIVTDVNVVSSSGMSHSFNLI